MYYYACKYNQLPYPLCSDTMTSNNVACSYNALVSSTVPQIHTLTYRSYVVCGNIVGAASKPVTVLLKGWLKLLLLENGIMIHFMEQYLHFYSDIFQIYHDNF